jgi:hypothetical protein
MPPRRKLELTSVGKDERPLLEPDLQARVDDLVRKLPEYLGYFDRYCPFSVAAMVHHVETMRLSRSVKDRRRLVQNPDFANSLYDTLVAWGMSTRGATLKKRPQFRTRLAALGVCKELQELQARAIFDLQEGEVDTTVTSIWRLVLRLDPVETHSVIVSGTKALHHVLPNIVPPVDREYTLKLLCRSIPTGYDRPSQRRRELRAFRTVFRGFHQVAHRRRSFIEDVVKAEAHCSRSFHTFALKVIDNAIIGARLQHIEAQKRRHPPVAGNG